MTWDPPLDLVGDRATLKVSASDVSSRSLCGRFLAIKTRPEVHSPAWKRPFAAADVQPLGELVDLVAAAHVAPEAAEHSTRASWLAEEFDARGTHRLLRPFLERAVENVLDAHEAIEGEVGSLRLLDKRPTVGRKPRQLTAWAPLYQTKSGVREIRRYRLGSAHGEPGDEEELWAAAAGHVAASFLGGVPPTRIRVTEVGALDGSVAVVFDGDPTSATAAFRAAGRTRAVEITEVDTVAPCPSCGSCKIAGVCDALVQVNGMLGQAEPGLRFRSVAPADLEQYQRCPAQWLLDRALHLPREKGTTEAQARGQAVHRWLRTAHLRGVGCRPEDLPEPGGELGIVTDVMTQEDYAAAYPYLLRHLEVCALGDAGTTVVALEESIYGFDRDAQVVPVASPDLVLRRDQRLIVREVKTTSDLPAHGRDEAYSKHLQVPFMLAMLASGYTAQHGAAAGTVELELLTPAASEVWAWHTDDELTIRVAAGDLRRAVDDWHTDDRWNTRPGPCCTWCPVREWCPDRDQYVVSRTRLAGAGHVPEPAADEPPPF